MAQPMDGNGDTSSSVREDQKSRAIGIQDTGAVYEL
jgi:hypothetical protein